MRFVMEYWKLAKLVKVFDALEIENWTSFWANQPNLPAMNDVHRYLWKYL